ncbi:hypothetical protein B6V72_18365 [Thioclava sp. F34-6]|nr:hypothetical protein B6V72_18365 [Thioclava sp. F34-6]
MNVLRTKSLPGLFRRTAIAMALCVLATSIFVAKILSDQALNFRTSAEHKLLLRGADAVALSFNTALTREWGSLHAVADAISFASPAEKRRFLAAAMRASDQVAWVGFASLDGTIQSASDSSEEGSDVSARRWFLDGLQGPSVNVNTDAGNDATVGTPEGYLDLSARVRGARGQVAGVLDYRLRIEWVRTFLLRASKDIGIDVIVQDNDGKSIIDTRSESAPLPASLTANGSLHNKSSGAFQLVGGKDGATYALAPDFFRTSLPGLEWPVFVVLRQNQLESDLPALTWVVLSAIAIAAISILAGTLLFLKLLLHPVERLALAAKNIANGTYVALKASNSSREAGSLSSALAVIQDKLLSRSDKDRSDPRTH